MNETGTILLVVFMVAFVAPAHAQTMPSMDVALTAAVGTAPSFIAPDVETAVSTIAVDLQSQSTPENVNVIVSHKDPAGETIVDRVVPVEVVPHEPLSIGIQDLRSGVNYTVRAVDGDIALPKVSNITDFVDGNATGQLAGATVVIVPPADHARRSNSAVAYRGAQAPAGSHFQYRQLLALDSGLVVLLYLQQAGESGQDIQDFVIRAHVSRDGGRTFGAPIDVTDHMTDVSRVYFRAAGRSDGTVAVLWDWSISGQPPRHGHGFTDLDPVNAITTPAVAIGDLPGFYPGTTIVALPNGTMFLPIGYLYNLHLWMVTSDGQVHHTGVIKNPDWQDSPAAIAMDATLTGSIGMAFNIWEGSTTSVWYTRSLDGARTFSAPEQIHADPNWYFQVSAASIDATQTLHVGVRAFQLDSAEQPSQYARINIAGDVMVRSYAEAAGIEAEASAYNPLLTASGTRVWLMWYNQQNGADASNPGIHLSESVDGGLTFGQAYHLIVHYDGAAFPNSYGEQLEVERDGTPLIVSSAGSSTQDILVVPLFDSLADVESGLVRVGAAFNKASFTPFASAEAIASDKETVEPVVNATSENDPEPVSRPIPTAGLFAMVSLLLLLLLAPRRRSG